jgi:nucleoside-diphosphate-sugar epimerase
MKRVLIIGGTGYIGSALYKHLTEQKTMSVREVPHNGWLIQKPSSPILSKYLVDTVDLEWFGNFTNPNNFIMDYRDLTPEQLAKYDVVVLLAGHSSVPMSNNSDAQSTFKNNVDNFVQLLGKLRAGQRFIYAGSSSVYNGIPDDDVTEDYLLLAPSNVYDYTKQDIDRFAALFPDIEYYGLRFATVNGISDNLRTDIMINMMVENAVLNNEVKLFNPGIRRPILHIKDLCRAIQAIIDSKEDKRGIYNLSSFNATAGGIAEGVADVAGVDLKRVSQQDVEKTLNSKLPTAYDFSISAKKFEETFDFKFSGTLKTIVEEVQEYYENVHKEKRIKAFKYGK